jgi:uncharacterized OB-fold protein
MIAKGAKKEAELLVISSGNVEAPYNYHAGYYWSKFFREMRDNKKIYGIKCPRCGKVYIPPRVVCGPCFVKLEDWVEVGPKGTVTGFSVVNFPLLNATTGEPRKIPFGLGYIKLDGADTLLMHYLEELDETKVKSGTRVEVVFREERLGNIDDIKFFRTIEE